MKIYQRTIAKSVSATGIGLHSGKKIKITLKPLPSNSGIFFKRINSTKKKMIKAEALTVGVTENNTSIGSGEDCILTVEHLLSVLYGLGIDNILCEIDGPEIPIMDGSGASFLFPIKEAGIKKLSEEKSLLAVKRKVKVTHGEKWASFEPALGFKIESWINFNHPAIGAQRFFFEFSSDRYIKEIVRARTFGFLRDVDLLKEKGLVKGGSLKNAIVLDDFNVLNKEGLRFENELIRHKVLDTIGDLSLLGHAIAGKVKSYKAGHFINNQLCRKLLENKDNYEIVKSSDVLEFGKESFSLDGIISLA
ncbi:MAG: UDP-3-O-[3-hydroxymyristoyl] N-acetylglucosamine deacetylase [Halobacteriovoraceae bacterium]|nr:UDP-3-O-[3-hydroxymyristoyl] N-acetylglucosamine deacetylase [Halobacteriovoraceae bacterium]